MLHLPYPNLCQWKFRLLQPNFDVKPLFIYPFIHLTDINQAFKMRQAQGITQSSQQTQSLTLGNLKILFFNQTSCLLTTETHSTFLTTSTLNPGFFPLHGLLFKSSLKGHPPPPHSFQINPAFSVLSALWVPITESLVQRTAMGYILWKKYALAWGRPMFRSHSSELLDCIAIGYLIVLSHIHKVTIMTIS